MRIIDLQDPTNPVEAGHFYVPEQIEKDADDVKFGDHLFHPFVHAVTEKMILRILHIQMLVL